MSYNGSPPSEPPRKILLVRLGAMGDVIHTLPAVARLKQTFPESEIHWAIEPRWKPLLEGNPHVGRAQDLPLRRWRRKPWHPGVWSELLAVRRTLRAERFDVAVDFQGLLKSAVVARLSGAPRLVGFASSEAREPAASRFYSEQVRTTARHVVEKNLELVARLGATQGTLEFPLPPGKAEPGLPSGEYILASPVAGWKAKQWPPAHYAALASLLWRERKLPLVIDCAGGDDAYCRQICGLAPPGSCLLHVSSLAGLIAATRRARAVVGVDSGPLHLAAALGVPGVALFCQTDPERNGPYCETFTVLRAAGVETTYTRHDEIHRGMAELRPEQVWQALQARLKRDVPSALGQLR